MRGEVFARACSRLSHRVYNQSLKGGSKLPHLVAPRLLMPARSAPQRRPACKLKQNRNTVSAKLKGLPADPGGKAFLKEPLKGDAAAKPRQSS